MAITRLELTDFTSFRSADVGFASGINVFLGGNATGKTHLMKVVYATLKAADRGQLTTAGLDVRLADKLARVFRPDDLAIGRLGHRRPGQKSVKVAVHDDDGAELRYSIYTKTNALKIVEDTLALPPSPIFLPSREALAMHEGFVAAYQKRELSFDETYYDLALSLDAKAVRGVKPPIITMITQKLESVLGGKVLLDGDRFYVGGLEAHLLSEGMRKIASVVRLLANNELRERGVLFWDEPEANLNPHLAVEVADMLVLLAKQGIQVFVSTHDYLLSETLGLAARSTGGPESRFFSFTRDDATDSVEIDSADDLDLLPKNLIRDEFLRHYDRVRAAP